MSWLKNNFQLRTVFTTTTVNDSANLSLLAKLLCFLCVPFVAIVRENYCLPRFHGKNSEILSQSHAYSITIFTLNARTGRHDQTERHDQRKPRTVKLLKVNTSSESTLFNAAIKSHISITSLEFS